MMKHLIHTIISPRSVNKDKARREFILNVLLVGSLGLTLFALILLFISQITNNAVEDALTPFIVFVFLLFLLLLYQLSRKGKVLLSSLLLVSFFYLSGFYTFLKWGVDVTQAWLIFAFLIVMSGVLVGTRFAFFLAVSLVIVVLLLANLQLQGVYEISSSWRDVPWTLMDIVLLNGTLTVIAIVAWLSNRETEKSLQRARASEAALKQERNLLEIKVEERTKELKQAQLDKVMQLYRFAEIGRLSSSLFHDLVTPLSQLSLNLEELKDRHEKKKIEDMKVLLQRAITGTKQLEISVYAVRQQLQNQETKKTFSLNKEIKQIIRLVQYKIRGMKIKVIFDEQKEIKVYGNNVKFSQLVTNLLLNAIDAYDGVAIDEQKRKIIVLLRQQKHTAVLSVTDFGKGIKSSDLEQIFQPFFTTKSAEKGTGIGLSISRDIVEGGFCGKITVVSSKETGTVFMVTFPIAQKIITK